MAARSRCPGFRPVRKDRLIKERVHDTYKSRGKLREQTRCPQCGAVVLEGRWQWVSKAAPGHEEMCPACQRIRDRYPAGFVTVGGPFLTEHRDEILNLARNEGTKAKTEHPLKRIMKIEEQPGGFLITTTDIHLARAIGEALHRAYQGELDYHYNEEDYMLRVNWRR